ncbi:hypothetical protein ACODM8_09595 [Vibrio ostreicida]|uniref:hypothetical protein n=1 Tax=Vibrio ostreicida TaxID=526588 RepID=UPI003B5BD1D5
MNMGVDTGRGNGYDGYSKSNNAIAAEEENKFTLTEISKRTKLHTKTIKKHFDPCEWHHTSSYYNKTDYYDLDEIMEELTDEIRLEDKALKADLKSKVATVHKGCTAKWLEWSGTRKSPKARECEAVNCTISIKGNRHTIIKPDGTKIVKMEGTKGFSYITGKELKEIAKREKLESAKMKQAKSELNTTFNEMFKGGGTKILVADYFENVVRIDDEITPLTINIEFTSMSKKQLVEELKEAGANYSKRTINECSEQSYSRLGKDKLVIISKKPEEVIEKLNHKFIDNTLAKVQTDEVSIEHLLSLGNVELKEFKELLCHYDKEKYLSHFKEEPVSEIEVDLDAVDFIKEKQRSKIPEEVETPREKRKSTLRR